MFQDASKGQQKKLEDGRPRGFGLGKKPRREVDEWRDDAVGTRTEFGAATATDSGRGFWKPGHIGSKYQTSSDFFQEG